MPSWKGKSRGGAFGHRFFIFLINKLGIRSAYAFLTLIVVYFIPFAPSATKASYSFFGKILGYSFPKTIKMLFLNYYRFGQILIDKVAVRSNSSDKYRYEFENYDRFLSVLNGNTGVIMIGAHVGNWEIGGTFFGEYASKINIVMFDAEYQKIKDVIDQNSEKPLYKVIPVSDQNFEHIYGIKEALENNEYICFQGDRFVSDNKSYEYDFFGKKAKFPAGPFYLAERYGVPVVFYFSIREKGMKYRFKFFVPDKSKNKDKKDGSRSLAQQYVTVLENIVREYPEQWFNFYDFWNE